MPLLLPSILPFLILQLALSSTPPPVFRHLPDSIPRSLSLFIRISLSHGDKRREARKTEERRGRGKEDREMRVNAPILSTPSLKLLLFTAPSFMYAISDIKVG